MVERINPDDTNLSLVTPNQQKIIEGLNHPTYTPEYIQHWMSRNDLVDINPDEALTEAKVEGFMAAIAMIEKILPDIDNAETVLSISRYQPGMEDTFECTKTCCGRFDVENCEDCDWNTHMPCIVDNDGNHIHPGPTAHVVHANGKRYVINEDLAKTIADNIVTVFKIAGLDISHGDNDDENEEQS